MFWKQTQNLHGKPKIKQNSFNSYKMDLNSPVQMCVIAQLSNSHMACVCCFCFQGDRDCVFTLKFNLLRNVFQNLQNKKNLVSKICIYVCKKIKLPVV